MSENISYHVAVLPGDGIGAEVVTEAEKVLLAVGQHSGQHFVLEHGLVGGAAMDATGEPLPEATLSLCRTADAVLMGAVGDPKYDDPQARLRPEQALLGLRQGLGLFANLRPVKAHASAAALTEGGAPATPTVASLTASASPLRSELLRGVDLMIVRELTGGLYFGQPRLEGEARAVDTMVYTREEVERIAHVAFQLARDRRSKVTSVDKANVLACSRLWRRTVDAVAEEYPTVQLEHLLVDATTMHLLKRPRDFDVILTANLFGDILSDEASVLAGSMGMLPSASLAGVSPATARTAGRRLGLYEPVHGSAPDIAGRGVANPLAAILSTAMLLRHSLALAAEAEAVEAAVAAVLEGGARTADLLLPDAQEADKGLWAVGTREMGDLVVEAMGRAWQEGKRS
jgi:3-isopropylmalate dehydrogenase